MSYKLYYFDARGVAEPIRWLLAVGDIEYEDIRSPMTFPPVLIPEIKESNIIIASQKVVKLFATIL